MAASSSCFVVDTQRRIVVIDEVAWRNAGDLILKIRSMLKSPISSDAPTNREQLACFNSTSNCKYRFSYQFSRNEIHNLYDEILPARIPEPCPTGQVLLLCLWQDGGTQSVPDPRGYNLLNRHVVCMNLRLNLPWFQLQRSLDWAVHLSDDRNFDHDQVIPLLHHSDITCPYFSFLKIQIAILSSMYGVRE